LNVVAGTTYTVLDFVEFQLVDGIVKSVQFVVLVEHRSQEETIQTHPMLSGSMR
jgi:riboflavin transporter FmnP